MPKKILLIAINSSWYQSSLTLYYLRQELCGLDYEVKMLTFSTKDLSMDLLSAIYTQQPDILCFSAYIWNRTYLQALLPDLRQLLPQAIMVAGGPEAPALQALMDIVFEGAAEGKFRHLAASGFRQDVSNGRALPLSAIPFPYQPQDIHTLAGKLVYYETSRGCPYSCAYCLSSLDKRNEQRFDCNNPQDLQKLADELDALQALKPRTVKFVDRSFNLHPPFARALWKLLLSKERSCEFHFEIYPELLEEEDIQILEDAPPGLIRFETGVQSTNDEINRACGRRSRWQKTKTMLFALRDQTKVTVHADLLCGLPQQSYQDVLDSINELAPCLPEEIQLGMLKILPGTPMQQIAREKDWLWSQNPPYTTLKTDKMSFEELRLCEDLARLLNLYWNKGEFTQEWQKLLQNQSCSQILMKLLELHKNHGYTLHSISKAKREELFLSINH